MELRRPGNMSDVIKNKLGPSARCPRCGNETDFTAYMATDVISVNVIADRRVDRPWLITEPNLGMLRMKDVRCGRCGYRNTPRHFSKVERVTDEEI